MTEPMHPLLLRQLRKLGLTVGGVPDAAQFADLLSRVSRAYVDMDQDRYLMERSENLASQELVVLNQALQASQDRLAKLLSLSSDWVWEQDFQGRFSYISDGLEARTGVKAELLIGHACSDTGRLRTDPAELARLHHRTERSQPFQHITFEVALPDQPPHYFRISGEPVLNGEQCTGYRGVGSDVTAAVLADQRIQELARYDSLTGLPNRYMVNEVLDKTLARCKRYERRFALLFIDLDRFKYVNDNLGHAAGDELLREVSRRLSGLLREADLLGRLGGDEFVVITEAQCDPATLAKIASRILGVLAEPLMLEGCRIAISASIGIVTYPNDAGDGPGLLKSADTAMYQAKANGKNTFAFFTADLARKAALHFALEEDLRTAVERQQLVLHYQPQVNAQTGELVGLEALLRWRHPERGLLAPSVFNALAEESGLIVPIGRWVLEAVGAQMATWRAEGLRPPRCAVNLSRRQLVDDSLLSEIQAVLIRHGLAAGDLELEVTEVLLMADTRQAYETLQQLNALGINIAIDDFGTGYSSLAYLKRFPAQTLKIDRSFVSGLPGSLDDLAIVRAVVAMGKSLGLRIVAEGVETAAQQACLQRLDCDALQGYFFGRPMDALAVSAWLRLTDGQVLA